MKWVPLTPSACFSLRVELDGYPIDLRFKKNFITSQWMIDVACEPLGLQYAGVALVTGDNLFGGHAVPELGKLVLIDLQGDADPDFDSLGDRWKLVYMTKAEVDEL